MPSLTQDETRRREQARRAATDKYCPAEIAAFTLIDLATIRNPEMATRAMHVAMYAQRIGRAMSLKTSSADLWVLGALSVLRPPENDSPIFAKYAVTLERFFHFSTENHDVHADILHVAHAFEDAVEQSTRNRGETSPAEAVRMMMRDRGTYQPLVVAALRRALSRPTPRVWAAPRAA